MTKDVLFSRVKTKKKKKSTRKTDSLEVIAKNLPNVIYSGELLQKGKLSMWPRRYAVVQDTKLLVFKSDKESKPLVNICLSGCVCVSNWVGFLTHKK